MARQAPSSLLHPGVHFPPPVLFVAGFLGGLALERWAWRLQLPGDGFRAACVLIGWLAIAGGLLFAGWGRVLFLRVRTSVMPNRAATRLVTSGPYRYSRNPMYLGLSVLYLGLALVFNVAWPLVLFPVVIVALARLVIRREERYLANAFGEAYTDYQQRVRRWL
jgi:protein-S-isoprenylcysteine O-methyltransferase Ste14